MRGEMILKILEILAEATSETTVNLADFVTVFLEAGYGASQSRFDYLLSQRERNRERKRREGKINPKNKRNLYNLLYYLKKDGLITKNKKQKILSITQKGINKLKNLKEKLNKYLPKRIYKKEKDTNVKIIIFDIPEKQRSKRDWLRNNLILLGFSMVQKSVFFGKNKIPREFIKDLKNLNLLSYVEIFAISREGTLKQIKERN